MLESTLIYFLLIFTPSLIVGLWQLFDDNILKQKYEKRLSEKEIEDTIHQITGLDKKSLDIFDKQFIAWCDSWSKNDMSSCQSFTQEDYFEILKLQIEGFIDTNQTRHIEISKDHAISYLNLDTTYKPKICLTKKQKEIQEDLKLNSPIRLRLKFEGEIADYQTEKTKENTDAFVIGNEIPYERDIILDYYLIDKSNPSDINSWKFVGTKAYSDYFSMKEKKYPLWLDKLLNRNKGVSL